MLATFVIGLREGLEAALIVGIIAAFLKRNGRSLAAMWWGVALALVLAVGVGVLLWGIEAALPQAAQEGMETVIGAVAVVFVTGMVLWMNQHGRTMKKELESSASDALGSGTVTALAVMAFLAVLKEGFETSVFLLATFRAAESAAAAAGGAVLGVLGAVVVGVGIYAGGIRLNLARFFRITGVFLLLVAAGLTLTAVRTAHEAGWLNGGQQRTVDLSWLAPAGSVQASLLTGVLGIPADPRLIEVVAWFAYLVPTALVVFWPVRRRPGARTALRLRAAVAASLLGAAAVLALAVPAALAPQPAPAALALVGGGTARLVGDSVAVERGGSRTVLPVASRSTDAQHAGVAAQLHAIARGTGDVPGSMTLQQVVSANGGRLPVGMNAAADPGPFTTRSTTTATTAVWIAAGHLLDLRSTAARIVVLTGGGLAGSRTVSLGTASIAASSTSVAAAAAIGSGTASAPERLLWGVQVPLALLTAGALLVLTALLRTRRTAGAIAARLPDRSSSYAVK